MTGGLRRALRFSALLLLAAFALARSGGPLAAQSGTQAPPTTPAAPALLPPALTAPPSAPRPPLVPQTGQPQAAPGKTAQSKGAAAPVSAAAKAGDNAGDSSDLLGLGGNSQGGEPVNVEADQGIEWAQEKQEYIARGNAKATRGDVTVYGQTLIAYYRKTPSGGSDIWRLDADDDVKIATPTDTAVGDKGVYDVDNGVFVLTGKHLELDTPKGVITARDSLEYWKLKQFAVARGNAKVVREDKTVTADILEAHFKTDAKGQLALSYVEAFNNVTITAATAVAHAVYGNYNVDTDVADLKGSIKITRGQDQLNGECATMNTNTGISRLYACGKEKQVRGLLIPKQGAGGTEAGGLLPSGKPASGGTSK